MKKRKAIVVMLALFFGLLVGGSVKQDAYAEQIRVSLTVSPQHQSIVLNPGETYHGSIKVSNAFNSTYATGYEVSVGSFSRLKTSDSKDDYGDINYIDRSTYNMIMDWIKIEEPIGSVEPNETTVVPFTIEVPEDAPAGGQYASFIVKDTSKLSSEGEGVAVDNVLQILSILYAEVTGTTREEGVISTNSMPSFLLNGPLTAESMVRNNGNVHTRAEYTLQVWPLFSDEEICTNEENPETSMILPDTERYHAQTCELPSVGIFKAKQVVKIFGETSIVERTVIICPLWLLFLILFVIIVIVIWIVTKVRGNKKRGQSRSDD